MTIEIAIKDQLDRQEIELNERLGQNFLVDADAIADIASMVIPGSIVIEVGSGIGHVTEALAQRASKVIGIEIDRRFEEDLQQIEARTSNVTFVMGDALKVGLKRMVEDDETQIVANLPFHITEPFLTSLVDLPIENAILLLGDNAAKVILEDESSFSYGKMSLVAQTFFDIRKVRDIPNTGFYPQPRTHGTVVELTPRERQELLSDPANYVLAEVVRKSAKHGLVINDLKQAIVDAERVKTKGTLSKQEANQKGRANVRREMKNLVRSYNNGYLDEESGRGKPKSILSQADALERIEGSGIKRSTLEKPFFALNNSEVRELVKAVKSIFRSRS